MFLRTCTQQHRHLPVHALWLVFFLNGAVLSSWTPNIPAVKNELGLSDTQLGVALLCVALGSVPAVLVSNQLLHRVSSRTVCLISAAVFAAALPLIPAATGALMLGLNLALLGAASGALDVAMNTAGIEYQHRRKGTPIISRLHGGYSLGVLVGSAGAAAAIVAGVPISAHFITTAVVLLALLSAAGPHLPRHGHAATQPDDIPPARISLRQVVTVSIAAVAVAGLLIEGTIVDWSALLIARDFDAGLPIGSTVVVLFSLAMFLSRSTGDWVVTRLGPTKYLFIAAITAAIGTSVGLLIPHWIAPYVGLVVTGLVLGPVFPLTIHAATTRMPTSAVSAATAAVSTIGYLAYLGGPPLVGITAQAIGLPCTMAILGTVCGIAIAVSATAIGSGTDRPSPGTS